MRTTRFFALAAAGVLAIEDYLSKHLAFLDFLEDAAASN